MESGALEQQPWIVTSMNIGSSIVIIAAWLPVAACAISNTVTAQGLNKSRKDAWSLTFLAIGYEIASRWNLV